MHIHKQQEGREQRKNRFYDQVLEEVKETAEMLSKRMAEVLTAMNTDRIEAERIRREAGTKCDAIESKL